MTRILVDEQCASKATNRATADFLISSPLLIGKYDRIMPDNEVYRRRLEAKIDD